MTGSMSLLLLAGLVSAAPTPEKEFDSYTKAYRYAQETDKPLLVILNPGKDSGESISIDDVRKTQERRELLANYVVAVVDTETEHGKQVYEVFDKPQLPRVAVIDKEQKWQVYRTSDKLQGYQWTEILKTFKTGEKRIQLVRFNYCPSCQRYAR